MKEVIYISTETDGKSSVIDSSDILNLPKDFFSEYLIRGIEKMKIGKYLDEVSASNAIKLVNNFNKYDIAYEIFYNHQAFCWDYIYHFTYKYSSVNESAFTIRRKFQNNLSREKDLWTACIKAWRRAINFVDEIEILNIVKAPLISKEGLKSIFKWNEACTIREGQSIFGNTYYYSNVRETYCIPFDEWLGVSPSKPNIFFEFGNPVIKYSYHKKKNILHGRQTVETFAGELDLRNWLFKEELINSEYENWS